MSATDPFNDWDSTYFHERDTPRERERYYVMGYDGAQNDMPLLMTRRSFPSIKAAQMYAKNVAQGWRAFIVQRIV